MEWGFAWIAVLGLKVQTFRVRFLLIPLSLSSLSKHQMQGWEKHNRIDAFMHACTLSCMNIYAHGYMGFESGFSSLFFVVGINNEGFTWLKYAYQFVRGSERWSDSSLIKNRFITVWRWAGGLYPKSTVIYSTEQTQVL